MIYLANNVTSSIKLAFEIIFFSHFVKSFPSLGLCRAGQGRIQGCAGQGRGEYRVVQDRVGAYTGLCRSGQGRIHTGLCNWNTF